ncbi:hypothetical protein V1477_008972 [Vespula maculifrons]|uniref:Uncharacterized protein n=1 Tax=Vespula maculifrons TaxID=7453 RepID=A0ABD2CEJ3_VESMC
MTNRYSLGRVQSAIGIRWRRNIIL